MRSRHRSVARVPRHPFRQSVARAHASRADRGEDDDIKLFVLSFTAFFICFYTLIF
ncbi:hypothetical protein PX554_16885 [Sphingomonas sp. H39-1-10]|uniref:hypothetical protein n=1 Tax=Sphingomonas TaxID=13687 RepID=UPI00088CD8D3|nr:MULTISPECIES: hypothetical protein [Sphingomonas]MDF0489813.1 hypothetical protein [Sphingomonas pollutisoli]SDA31723.1 hypothetical protein SAMN03159340_02676 [Sphingomonas sp. NFR15]